MPAFPKDAHTPTPWRLGTRGCKTADNWFPIERLSDNSAPIIAWGLAGSSPRVPAEANAAFIVRACNSHEKLRQALITISNVGSGEAQRLALETLRSIDEGNP